MSDTEKIAVTYNIDQTTVADFQQMCEEHSAESGCTETDCPAHTPEALIEYLMVNCIRGHRIEKARSYGIKPPQKR